jgi:hypothetical protein
MGKQFTAFSSAVSPLGHGETTSNNAKAVTECDIGYG